MSKAIITAAITGGIHTPTMSPHLPITPSQIADEAVRSYEAGAAIAHIHVRDPATGSPLQSLDLMREVITDVKSRCNIILCLTTGGPLGVSVKDRVAPVSQFKPELASLNFGSMNFSVFPLISKIKDFKFPWEAEYLAGSEDQVFPNTFKTLREFCEIFHLHNTKPEIEIYDVGMINNLKYALDAGYLQKPVHIQFVMGILGGIPASMENLIFMRRTAASLVGDFSWSACAAGKHQINMCTTALMMGGNARVGLEDSLYLEKGVKAKSNAQQVEKIVRIAKELGIGPATPDETRELLGLKGLANVNY